MEDKGYRRETRYVIDKGMYISIATASFLVVSGGTYTIWDKIKNPMVLWIMFVAVQVFVQVTLAVCMYSSATAVCKDIRPSRKRLAAE